ncbi:GNAT family N-acetyltransferase [Halomarina rubra]|uniref:GNAT family N-acetyltransferase n=1 Tax=Halomarina rubra TaxID=2071873 RepID=A0ABD6AX97_9EURY|nr:GNAT family protein [Halomarina rubra]
MPGPVFLDDGRVELRTVREADYEFVLRVLNDPRIRHNGYETYRSPVDESDVAASVEAADRHTFLVCTDGTPVGSVALKNVDLEGRNAELGYWVAPEEQGNGYATAAADLCLTHAFDELGLHKVWARTVGDNDASNRVLEKLGFDLEGVLEDHWYGIGRYVDEHRYGLINPNHRRGAESRRDE